MTTMNANDIETQYAQMQSTHTIKKVLEPTQTTHKVSCPGNVFAIFCSFAYVLIAAGPIAICDLYFSQSDYSCLHKYSNAAQINMQTYLLASGIIEIVLIFTIPLFIYYMILFNNKERINSQILCFGISITMITYLLSLFLFAWNVVGAVVFWGHVYDFIDCSHTVSNYIFASLIIKFSSTFLATYNSDKK